ncbi:MAG: hypothetical protein MK441_01660, partial [SAR324 cluster bacterium]|nr:hypothetical protein [SAR324 cluster bacterium]
NPPWALFDKFSSSCGGISVPTTLTGPSFCRRCFWFGIAVVHGEFLINCLLIFQQLMSDPEFIIIK